VGSLQKPWRGEGNDCHSISLDVPVATGDDAVLLLKNYLQIETQSKLLVAIRNSLSVLKFVSSPSRTVETFFFILMDAG